MNIEKTYDLNFPVDIVYSAWVSSNTVIAPATAMDIEAAVGGHYRLFIESPEFTAVSEGEFLIVTPQKHLRYSWEWNGDGEVTEIDVRFANSSVQSEATQIQLEHSGFQKKESLEAHDSGWDSYIEGFKALLEA